MTLIKNITLLILMSALNFQFAVAAPSTSTAADRTEAIKLYKQAQSAMEKKAYEDAIDYIKSAEQLNSNNSKFYYLHAQIHSKLMNSSGMFSIRGHFVGMRENLEKVLKLDPHNIKAKHLLVELYSMLPSFLGGDKARADQLANEIYQQDIVEGNIAKANILIHADNNLAAIVLLKKDLLLAPHNIEVKQSLAELLVKEGKPKAAIDLYLQLSDLLKNSTKKNTKMKTQLSAILLQIANIALDEKKYYVEAETALLAYLKLKSVNEEHKLSATFKLADVYALQDKKNTARLMLEQAKLVFISKKLTKKINKKIKGLKV